MKTFFNVTITILKLVNRQGVEGGGRDSFHETTFSGGKYIKMYLGNGKFLSQKPCIGLNF